MGGETAAVEDLPSVSRTTAPREDARVRTPGSNCRAAAANAAPPPALPNSSKVLPRQMASVCKFLFVTVVGLMTYAVAESCLCMNFHPQEHYCSADFVAAVRVRRMRKSDADVHVYQIRTKKIFKANGKAEEALSHGLLWSNSKEAMCGLRLRPDRYLVTGRITGEKPWVSGCNFVQKWSTLTKKQRKGFRRLYRQGCHCKVRPLFGSRRATKGRYCSWETVWTDSDCQGKHSLCVPTPGDGDRCSWVNNSAYRHCMKRFRKEKEERKHP
ncbi:tissue inhibitor of metalloproteinase-like isoform X1 [Centruroides vittatus]|uniref:tissue inhibitor of metalloproteinase-like isoform X1 n=2 Tax=Centruroides vittatus TaxID=120091 RepID=UPI003510A3E0